ncbi:hypothetical protein ALC60_02793 [Trachymyrmex zeteki]|uniref:Uncharacterized protein n=1 Tax=Mycetomoellerius zeteki TaxID=64791 RepID=A0A151XDE4_9HYME|nr:hypothetical protein ALC60_02793 [Trachymyrmex zeteki]
MEGQTKKEPAVVSFVRDKEGTISERDESCWKKRDGDSWKERAKLVLRDKDDCHCWREKDERTGKGWANGDGGSGGNARDGEGEKRGERTAERKIEKESERESGGRVVVEERGSVVERPSRCGHELRRSGNVGSV